MNLKGPLLSRSSGTKSTEPNLAQAARLSSTSWRMRFCTCGSASKALISDVLATRVYAGPIARVRSVGALESAAVIQNRAPWRREEKTPVRTPSIVVWSVRRCNILKDLHKKTPVRTPSLPFAKPDAKRFLKKSLASIFASAPHQNIFSTTGSKTT